MLKQSPSASLLSRRDWVYLLGLLVPLVMFNLVLKALLVFSAPANTGSSQAFGLMQIRLPAPEPTGWAEGIQLLQSDLCFNLGYILLWTGLLAAARKGLVRQVMGVFLHLLTLCVVLVTMIAYQYFKATGSTLDAATLFLGLSSLDELSSLIASEVSLSTVVLVVVLIAYALLGPALWTLLLARSRGGMQRSQLSGGNGWPRAARLLALALAAGGFFWLAVLPGATSPRVSKSFARNPVVNVLLTSVNVAHGEALHEEFTDVSAQPMPSAARLVPRRSTQRRNVVLIFLESTRAAATTPYNKQLPTTPFMDELAERSLLVEKAYAVIPHTHNALMAINCGIYPPLDPSRVRLLALPDTLPDICLPHLLRAQGYNTVYFMSQVKTFENSEQIMKNLGYQDFYSLEHMDTAGFEPTNYFGVEDEVMLEPSRKWLQQHRDTPFLAAYLTSAPHHDYLAPQKRHGRVDFTGNDVVNRYLNSVRNQDFFIKQLFDQYRQLGLYQDTVFIILGDHGQGFGEHGRNGHDNAIYEEGLRIPLLIHDPQRFRRGARLAGPAQQLDILPTVADLLGYTINGGPYSGSSLLRALPTDRTLMFSCSGEAGCMASLRGNEKYIYHFDDRPEELFDLASDPGEQMNIAPERPPDEMQRRRAELVAWRAGVRAMYPSAEHQ